MIKRLVCGVEWRMYVEIYKENYLNFEMFCMEICVDEYLNYGMSNNSY